MKLFGDGDGWVHCSAGHRHWGRYGAAGLLLIDESQAVLQHRAPWTHEGGTWGLPGGARDSHESAVEAALREAHEEAALDAQHIDPIGLWIADHGGWSYTTVVARPLAQLSPHAANAESTEIRWWDIASVDNLPLHAGLAASWPALRAPVPKLVVLVPADLLSASLQLCVLGVPTAALPQGLVDSPLHVLFPQVIDHADEQVGLETVLRVGVDVPIDWLTQVTAQQVAGRAERS